MDLWKISSPRGKRFLTRCPCQASLDDMTTNSTVHVAVVSTGSGFRVDYLGTVYARTEEIIVLNDDARVMYDQDGEWRPVDRFHLSTITLDRFATVLDANHTDHTLCASDTCAVVHSMQFDALLALPAGHSA